MTQICHNSIFGVCDPSRFCLSELRNYQNQFGQQIWDNNQNLQYEEFVIMTPDTIPPQDEMQIYEWRREQNHFIVRTCYVEVLDNSYGFRQLRVFVEKTRTLLEAMGKLNWNQGLEVLKDSLKGYEKLYRKFGKFSITDGMISIDQKNKTKVWININFARNTPMHYQYEQAYSNEEGTMIRRVFKAIQPHLEYNSSLESLKYLAENSTSFQSIIRQLDQISGCERPQLGFSRRQSNNGTKYFSKTPENHRKEFATNCLKQSYNKQSSYKQILTRPSCLEFKQPSQKSKASFNKKSSTNEFQIRDRVQKKDSCPEFKESLPTTPYKSQFGNFQAGENSQKHYFRSSKNSESKNKERSKQKQTSQQSNSSGEISFKSQCKRDANGADSKFIPMTLLERFGRKRTGSTVNRSPSPATLEDRFQTSELLNPITKSMTIIKKQLEILNKMKYKDYAKESTSDFDCQVVGEPWKAKQSNQAKTAFDLPGARLIKQSIINDQSYISNTNFQIAQLKNSMFNRIDDLKQSQIIVENPQEHFGSKLSAETTYKLPPKQPKLLNKINKPMTQSITIESKQPLQYQRSPTLYVQSTLDKFARVRTQSRLHEPSKVSNVGVFVPIKETIEEYF